MTTTLSALRRVADVDLVLGTMYFGTRTDEATSFALLDRFVEAGGRVLDTANCYSFWSSPTGHGGQSEALLGRWLAANPGLRDELVIATKVGVEPTDDGGIEGLSAGGDRARVGAEPASGSASTRSTSTGRTARTGRPTWRRRCPRSARSSTRCGPPARRVQPPDLAGRTRPGIAERLGVEPSRRSSSTTSYVDPRPGAQVPGKDHRFGFVSDETVDYLDTHPELDLWVYSPLVQGSFDRADRRSPRPTTTRAPPRGSPPGRVAESLGVPASQVVLAWLSRRGWKPIVGVSSVEQLDSALAAVAADSRSARSGFASVTGG